MSKHSKNSCAHPVFSYAERKKLKWGTTKVRLGSDAIKPYDHCTLCLHQAKDPMVCPRGHLYCKSCIYEHLLTQKNYIKQQLVAWEQQEKKQGIKGATEEEKMRLAEIAKFDQSQSSINANTSKAATPHPKAAPKGYTAVQTASGSTAYIADRDLNSRLSSQHATLSEKQEKKSYLPCFWIPSMTPDAGVKKIAKPNEHTVCPDGQHTLRLKQLRVVRFTPANKSNPSPSATTSTSTLAASTPSLSTVPTTSIIQHMCASCRKTLNNTVKCSVITTCGHVMCATCIEQFVKKDGTCSDCGTECSARDVVELLTGTGFASSSGKVVEAQLNPGFVC